MSTMQFPSISWYVDRNNLILFGFFVIYAKTIIHLSVGESAGYFLYFGD